MAIMEFDNWTMFRHGEVCLKDEYYLFANQGPLKPKKILRSEVGEGYVEWEPHTSQNWYKYTMEFRQYADIMHSIVALCTDIRGQTRTLTIWISNKSKLVYAHELISQEKLIPIWEKLIGFMYECTTV